MTTTNEPFVAHVGEPRRPLAGFIDADFPGLPPEQAQALRALELADKAEERARQVEFAERREMAENRALAESASRSHARGRQWDPSNPWRDYPSHDVRVQEAFALQDVMAASELRQARREAAKVLREHGVHAQIVIDSNAAESPHPVEPAGVPASRSQGMAPSVWPPRGR